VLCVFKAEEWEKFRPGDGGIRADLSMIDVLLGGPPRENLAAHRGPSLHDQSKPISSSGVEVVMGTQSRPSGRCHTLVFDLHHRPAWTNQSELFRRDHQPAATAAILVRLRSHGGSRRHVELMLPYDDIERSRKRAVAGLGENFAPAIRYGKVHFATESRQRSFPSTMRYSTKPYPAQEL